MKVCSRCRVPQEDTEFYRCRSTHTRDGRVPDCRTCRGKIRVEKAEWNKAYQRAWYRANKDKSRAADQRRKATKGAELRAYQAAWARRRRAAMTREELAAYRRYHSVHDAKRYAANRETVLAARRQDYRLNPDKWKAWAANRRHRERAACNGPRPQLKDIFVRDDGRCWLCTVSVTWREATFDHVIPLSKGGLHVPENIRVACRSCNSGKKDRLLTPEQIAAWPRRAA